MSYSDIIQYNIKLLSQGMEVAKNAGSTWCPIMVLYEHVFTPTWYILDHKNPNQEIVDMYNSLYKCLTCKSTQIRSLVILACTYNLETGKLDASRSPSLTDLQCSLLFTCLPQANESCHQASLFTKCICVWCGWRGGVWAFSHAPPLHIWDT